MTTPDPVAVEIRKVCQERGLYKSQRDSLLAACKSAREWIACDDDSDSDKQVAILSVIDTAIAFTETAQPQGDHT
jgi:hypothetical protein